MTAKTFLEVQFPIGPLSLESYKERDAKGAKILASLGKWWGAKPLVLVRAIVIAAVFPASDDPDRWPDDLDIFLRVMCLDNDGMWKRKTDPLPAELCYPEADGIERDELFNEDGESWKRGAPSDMRSQLEMRVFFNLGHTDQREYCCRVEEIDGPSPESWIVINAYLGTSANTLAELVQQLSQRRYGTKLKVGDAFSGMGSIPFEAAELGCDVYASDLNPVACLLTWSALNLIGGSDEFRARVHKAQREVYDEVDRWLLKEKLETSEEGWRAEAYLYCVEMVIPEWNGWKIPICPSWEIAPKTKTWVELIPNASQKCFDFRVHKGGAGYSASKKGTKQGADVICPAELWEILKQKKSTAGTPRSIPYNQLIENAGGLRSWEKSDFRPRAQDILQERLFCIRWREPDWIDDRGHERNGDLVYREPRKHDVAVEAKVETLLEKVFDEWQAAGWIPNWRVELGKETTRLVREKGWTYWHHLFTARQLLMNGYYSQRIGARDSEVRAALTLNLGRVLDSNSKLCHWKVSQGGGIGGTRAVFYNQAFNTFPNPPGRGLIGLEPQMVAAHKAFPALGKKSTNLLDAREVSETCQIWITDPPYADAVNYEELSEFFLAWYVPHLKAVFPKWYTDSMRTKAVKGSDAPFRVAMADCYKRLAEHMPDNGMQVLMFTHKSTDVWEDLALIMWAAGLQVKQVWSVATETAGLGVRTGNYVQSTYNMVLRKRSGAKAGFVDFITPQVNNRVKEVITRMRESQIAGDLARAGYTDTDYLLAAQAVAAEVVTGYATIDGVDLDAELRTPNASRGLSALRSLMENAKRTATDFLVPPAMDRAIRKAGAGDPYSFWRQFGPEEKFLLKGLEGEAQGVFKIGAFQDLGRAYGLSNYEHLLGPTRANDSRTQLPKEMVRPEPFRFEAVPASDRSLWMYSPTRQIYQALKLLQAGGDSDRAVKHLIDTTDFWNTRSTRLAPIIAYLRDTTASLKHWAPYQDHLATLAIGVENARA